MKPVLLCVDDEKMVLDALVSQLQPELNAYCHVEVAESAADAWELILEFQEQNQTILLIISDWLMPIQKGDEFLIEFSSKFPKVPLILLSGHIDNDSLDRTKKYSNLKAFVRKPWDKAELLHHVNQWIKSN